jgi:hypothetical protein
MVGRHDHGFGSVGSVLAAAIPQPCGCGC